MADTLIVRRRIGDIETPVGAMLKLGADAPGSFLFESIVGGEKLGRYSFIGLMPKVWFRIQNGVGEMCSEPDFKSAERLHDDPVEALRLFSQRARATAKEALPPMASGAFGYVGYDCISYVEPVEINADTHLDAPDALLVIPQVVIIFDHLYQEILLTARAFDGDTASAEANLDKIEERLGSPPPLTPSTVWTPDSHPDTEPQIPDFLSNTSVERYHEIVETAREYIRAGDIFQVVPSQRFSAPFIHQSISLYRALRRLNPSAFMFHMSFGDLRLVGSSPEILVRVRDGRVAIRPIAGTRPRSGDAAEDARRADDLLNDQKEMAEHLMLLDL
ncbi:MAG: chorismate-binding protein, partial [Pseudomonadota bacterium]